MNSKEILDIVWKVALLGAVIYVAVMLSCLGNKCETKSTQCGVTPVSIEKNNISCCSKNKSEQSPCGSKKSCCKKDESAHSHDDSHSSENHDH